MVVAVGGQQRSEPAAGVDVDHWEGSVGGWVEPEPDAQDFGGGHLAGGLLGPSQEGQSGGGVAAPELDPLAPHPHQRRLAAGQVGEFGLGQDLIAERDLVAVVAQPVQPEEA